ncbi:MAG: hypothetical protein J6D34_06820 [Atopobiaceae bacterium]|nr:hypothetical protein [Atopobiaceae bacterium]
MADIDRAQVKAERATRYLARGLAFVVILVLLLQGVNSFLQPIWFYENNFNTYHGFYEEPKNSIETIFVGASMTLFGFSPMEMYEQDGISAYNLASTSQPMMGSYFWVKEAYRLQGETMDTVVIDVSMLRRNSSDEDYRKALDGMDDSSPVKQEAIDAMSEDSKEAIDFKFPLFGYHNRWSSINYTDFVKYDKKSTGYTRGYFMELSRIFEQYSPDAIPVPAQLIDPDAAPTEFIDESLFYFNKLIEFCDEKGIRLVLCKTPSPSNWTSGDHNGVQKIADSYNLTFVDLEIEPLLTELDYCVPLDSKDTDKHLNYYGAMKLSRWMSTYLANECGNKDMRGTPIGAHLDEQLEQYHRKVTQMAEATYSIDVVDYLRKVMTAEDYTVLISAKDDASSNLSVDQRLQLSKLGLSQLATIQSNDSYVGIVTDGKIEYEEVGRAPSWFDKDVDAAVERNEDALADEEAGDEPVDLGAVTEEDWKGGEEVAGPLAYSGALSDGVRYDIKSGGILNGNVASIVVDKIEYSPNQRGINIVVYDNTTHRVVDKTYFDTCLSSERSSLDYKTALETALEDGARYDRLPKNLQQLYRYQAKYDYAYEAKQLKQRISESGLYYYLDNYCHRSGLMVLIGVKDDAAGSLSEEARHALAELGLTEIETLGSQESYCAVFENGGVAAQSKGGVDSSASLVGSAYSIESAGYWAGNYCSIVIDQDGYPANYSPDSRGFNIVVYNPKLDIVVDTACFDTNSTEVEIP